MNLREISHILGSHCLRIGAAEDLGECEPLGYSIDSRSLRPGELFFAIVGENHDAHRFVEAALRRGALGAVVSTEFAKSFDVNGVDRMAWLLPVADTLEALQALAAAVRSSWNGREVAITGSAGKTSTKELTAALLARIGTVNKTSGNLNNDYGLPLSILRMESDRARAADFDYAVLEMGMNHKGEIARLVEIAPPDLGVVLNVAPVHLEFFESVEEIAEAKAELILGIKPGGAGVLNADDPRVARMKNLRSDLRWRTFGIESPADVRATRIRDTGLDGTQFDLVTPRGEVDVSLPLAGRHQVYNALAAAAVADFYQAGLDGIADTLRDSRTPKMRGELVQFAEGFTLVDDSYNSNPSALLEMASTIAGSGDFKRRIVVAGEMLELGASGAALHRETGRQIASLGIDVLIGVRGLARELVEGAREGGASVDTAFFFDEPEGAADFLKREARAGDLILVKGSRGVKTELVVERLKLAFTVGGADGCAAR